jgi:diadenosine tetraphosphate (Ap4A) HIT family hydrolase
MPTSESATAERPCGICGLIDRIRNGGFADLVAELPCSWVILGDAQFYRGYCVLLAKRHARELHLLPRDEVHQILDELLAVGQAIAETAKPLKLNYECLGNQEPHVHWHVFPRSAEDSMRLQPVWLRPEAERKATLDETDRQSLIITLRERIARMLPGARYADSER